MPRITRETACACCGRAFTRSVQRSQDVDHLCEPCNTEALDENAHSDGLHVIEDANCHACQGSDPHAGFRAPRVAGVGAGRVTSDTDGRLTGNAPMVPEDSQRIKLTGFIRGRRNPKYVGEASVIRRVTQKWNGHAGEWVQAKVDGIEQCRWFYAEEVTPVRASRRR